MSSKRSLSIDVIKLVAVFGVPIIHMSPSTDAAEAFSRPFWFLLIPFFLLISLHFFINGVYALPSLRLSLLRLDRILVPYAAWTVIYTLMRLVKFRLLGKPFQIDAIGLTFFGEGAVHLYFLPLLLLFQAEALALILLFRQSTSRLIGLCVALGAVLFGYVGSAGGYLWPNAVGRGLIYVGMTFLFRWMQIGAIGRQINVVIGWLTAAFIISTAFSSYPPTGYPPTVLGMTLGPIVGYGMLAFALNWHFHTTSPTLRYILTCSYGIYLAHLVFLQGLEFAAEKFGYHLAPFSLGEKIIFGSLICLCCLLFIVIARLHWLCAYLFLGEAANHKSSCSPSTSALQTDDAHA